MCFFHNLLKILHALVQYCSIKRRRNCPNFKKILKRNFDNFITVHLENLFAIQVNFLIVYKYNSITRDIKNTLQTILQKEFITYSFYFGKIYFSFYRIESSSVSEYSGISFTKCIQFSDWTTYETISQLYFQLSIALKFHWSNEVRIKNLK